MLTEMVLSALRKLLRAFTSAQNRKNAAGRRPFDLACDALFLSDGDRSILERELVADAAMLTALSEDDLESVGIAGLGVRRERVEVQAEGEAEQLGEWVALLENLLAVGAEEGEDGGSSGGMSMLREIVEVVWREGLGSDLARFRQRLAHWRL